MDLNLIPVFVAIYETRSITQAAARLFVTQSAVSQSLGRLRRDLADPLFERSGRAMSPTPVAEQAYPALRDAVLAVDGVLRDLHGFDPALSDRQFRIAMSALGEIGWLPRIARELAVTAPGARLEVVALEPDRLAEWLERGHVDVAVSPAELPSRYERTVVKSQQYVVVMSSAHPLAGRVLDRAAYARAAHVVVLGDSATPIVAAAEAQVGVVSGPTVAVQHFATVPSLLAERPDLLATVPAPIADGWAASAPVIVRPLPFQMTPIRIQVYQRSTTFQPAALEWFYALTCRVVAATATPFERVDDRL